MSTSTEETATPHPIHFPQSHKVYLTGSRPDIRVPERQIDLSTHACIRLYDTSGPYTDPHWTGGTHTGLPAL